MQTFSRQTYVDRIIDIEGRGGAFRGREDVLINVEGKPLRDSPAVRCTVKFLEVPAPMAGRLFELLDAIRRWQADPDGKCPQCARACWIRSARCVCGYLDAAGEEGGGA